MSPRTVLTIVADGVEEIELVSPVDILRRAGATVVMCAMGDSLMVTGRCGIKIGCDVLFSDLLSLDSIVDAHDALLVPGGPAVPKLRGNKELISLVSAFNRAGKVIASICAGPLVLLDAGVIRSDDDNITAHFSVHGEIPGASKATAVAVRDGGDAGATVITSRGAGTAVEFSLAFVGELVGEEEAASVRKAIMM